MEWFKVSRVAWKLGVTDRGRVLDFYRHQKGQASDEKVIAHLFCNTPLRAGAKSDGTLVHYCWRCEIIIPENPNVVLPGNIFKKEGNIIPFKRR